MNKGRPVLSATALKPTEYTFQHCVPCVDLPYISSLGAFMHAVLLRTYLSVSYYLLLYAFAR